MTTPNTLSLEEALKATPTSVGKSLWELNTEKPVLLVFLRHAGCTFCREAASDIQQRRKELEAQGVTIALVHMGSPAQGEEFFSKYGIQDLPAISDPDQVLYNAFGLERGSLFQLFGITVIKEGFRAGVRDGHGVGKLVGDGFQMPGVFLIKDGEILEAYRHKTAADRPDYGNIVSCGLYDGKE